MKDMVRVVFGLFRKLHRTLPIRIKVFVLVAVIGFLFIAGESIVLNRQLNYHIYSMAKEINASFSHGIAREVLASATAEDKSSPPINQETINHLLHQHPTARAIFVVDSAGHYLTESEPEPGDRAVFDRLIQSQSPEMIELSGPHLWGLTVPVIEDGEYKGSLLATLDLEKLSDDLEKMKWGTLILGAASWLILIATLFLAINMLIFKPLSRLSNTSARLASGDLTTRAKVSTEDEMGRLAGSYNIMADSLTRTIMELDKERDRLRSVMDTQDEYLFTVDDQRRITLVNQRLADLVGLSAEQIIGRECMDFIHSDNCEQNCSLKAENGGCAVVRDVEAEIRLPNDRVLAIRKNAQVLLDGLGNLVGAVETFRDISQEKDLVRLKGEWESFISHEIRSPLNPILGFSTLLMEAGDDFDSKDRKEYLKAIHDGAHNLDQILNMTREVQLYEAGEISLDIIDFDIRNTVAASINEAANALKGVYPDRAFTTEIIDDPEMDATVPHDPIKMQRVFKNLIKNAWEHHDGPVRIRISRDSRFQNIAIQNFGDPIPKKNLATIFEKFNTTKKGGGGTGLGTTIAKLFTEAHHGRITVSSSITEGTEFTVRLPL